MSGEEEDGFVVACRNADFETATRRMDKTTRENKRLALWSACATGCLPTVQWLVERLSSEDVSFDKNKAFRVACHHGQLDVAKWLADFLKLTEKDVERSNALEWSCRSGQLAVVEWLASRYNNFVNFWRRKCIIQAFQEACANGQLEIAQWVTEHLNISHTEVRVSNNFAFRQTCHNGHLTVAQWIAHRFWLKPEDAKVRKLEVLQTACLNGRLDIVQWLVEHFKLEFTEEDMSPYDPFATACYNGHLHIAQWLMENLKGAKMLCDWDISLSFACRNGHVHIVKWLVDYFKLSADNIRYQISSYAVKPCHALFGGAISVLKWMVGPATEHRCGSSQIFTAYEDTRIDHLNILFEMSTLNKVQICCVYGHFEIAQWLIECFDLGKEDIFNDNCNILQEVCNKGYTYTVGAWLVTHFQLTREEVETAMVDNLEQKRQLLFYVEMAAEQPQNQLWVV